MDETELPLHALKATCSTRGCVNYNKSFDCEAHLNADDRFRVICGMCGRYMTKLKYRNGQDASAKAFRA